MKRTILLGVLMASLLPMLLSSPSAGAAGFLQWDVQCPTAAFDLLPAGGRLRIEDVILSASGETNFTLTFVDTLAGGINVPLMKVFLARGGTVVSNFQGNVEGEDEFSLKATCSTVGGTPTTVSVTLVGSSGF